MRNTLQIVSSCCAIQGLPQTVGKNMNKIFLMGSLERFAYGFHVHVWETVQEKAGSCFVCNAVKGIVLWPFVIHIVAISTGCFSATLNFTTILVSCTCPVCQYVRLQHGKAPWNRFTDSQKHITTVSWGWKRHLRIIKSIYGFEHESEGSKIG